MKFLKQNDKANLPLLIVTLVGISVLVLRLLIWTDKFHSGLLYIAWPFALSLALYYFTPHTDGKSWKKRFWNNLRISMIILLASSVMLMEGYVCVVMFLPIFFFFVLVAFFAFYAYHRFGKGSIQAQIIPFIVVLASLEGVTNATTFNRYNEVTYSQVVQTDIGTIKERLERPPEPQGKRHWILALFPMPRTIGSVVLEEGAVRTYEFEYHRWFAANTHSGQINVTFVEVSNNRVKTTIEDTSYISGYLKLHGTELTLEPVSETATRVTLNIEFDRMIDPVWYFEPLQRFAVEKSARYFIEALLSKGT